MGHSNVNLAALIGSRICHDLISPVGAINNGIELLGMAGNVPGPEIELISESVNNASARIRFFRVAYGASGEQMVGRAETVSILRDLYDKGRLDVAWGPLDAQPRNLVRLAFLALQCLETAMPYGGRIEIAQDSGSFVLTGQADKLNIDADLWALLANADAPVTLQPAQVQFALLPTIAGDENRKVTVCSTENQVAIRF